MTRFLKPKNIHRLIIALLLLAPIVYLFGTWFAYLIGAHGAVDSVAFDSFFGNNWLFYIGRDIIGLRIEKGFVPVGDLLRYIDDNFLHFQAIYYSNIHEIAMTGYGYLYYVCHVLILDLIAMAFVFIITIPHKLLDWFNGHAGGDW